MQIKSVIRYINGHVRIMHDISVFTLIDVLGGNDGVTDIIIGVDDDGLNRYFNLSKLLSSQPMAYNDLTTWDKLEAYLNTLTSRVFELIETKVMVPSCYLTKKGDNLVSIVNPYLSNSSNQIRVYSGDNDTHINLEYGSVHFPTVKNQQTLRHLLTDVVITSDYGINKLNFKNTLPVINGVVCYPEFTEDGGVLYARDGVEFIANRKQFCSNTVLIDVSNLGDMECIKLSKCSRVGDIEGLTGTIAASLAIRHGNLLEESENGTFIGMSRDSASVYSDDRISFTFDLPSGKTGVPVLVLFGRIITTIENCIQYTTINDRIRVTCSIPRATLQAILISNLEKQGKCVVGTPFYKSYLSDNLNLLFTENDRHDHDAVYEDAEKEYISRMLDNATSFVALIKTDRKVSMSIKQATYRCNNKALWFESVNPVGGILVNPITLEVVDYTRIAYTNGALLTMFQQTPLFSITNDNIDENMYDVFMSVYKPTGKDTGLFTNIRDINNLVLVDIHYESEDEEATIIPPEYEELQPSGSFKDTEMVDPIIPAETRLVIGNHVSIGITAINKNKIMLYGSALNGTYERTNLFSKFEDAVWYCRENGEVYQLYNEDNFWYLGKVGEEPMYRSSDNNGVLMPWNTSFIKWYTLEVEEVGTSSGGVKDMGNIVIGYIDENTIYVTSNYPGIIGKYTLTSTSGSFSDRVWSNATSTVAYVDSTWEVAIDGKVVYKSEEAMSSSSPWHHLEWNYLGE